MNTTMAREQQALLPAQEYQESALPPKHWLQGSGASSRVGIGHKTRTAGHQDMLRARALRCPDSSAPNKRPERSASRPFGLVNEACSTTLHVDTGLSKPVASISTRAASGGDLDPRWPFYSTSPKIRQTNSRSALQDGHAHGS